jgi:hypothetical protein
MTLRMLIAVYPFGQSSGRLCVIHRHSSIDLQVRVQMAARA